MHTTYFDEDDILVIRLSDKPIVREVLQNWNTHISYAKMARRLKWCCWRLAPMALIRWKFNMPELLEGIRRMG